MVMKSRCHSRTKTDVTVTVTVTSGLTQTTDPLDTVRVTSLSIDPGLDELVLKRTVIRR